MPESILVESPESCELSFDAKPLSDRSGGSLADSRSAFGICHEPRKQSAQRRHVSGRVEKARSAVVYEVWHPGKAGCHDRTATGHRFYRCEPK